MSTVVLGGGAFAASPPEPGFDEEYGLSIAPSCTITILPQSERVVRGQAYAAGWVEHGIGSFESSSSVSIRIPQVTAIPEAFFTVSPESPGYTQLITFDASSSKPGDAPIESYEWDFDADRDVDRVAPGQGQTIERAYLTPGTYNITLTVTDTLGNSNTSFPKELVVSNQCNSDNPKFGKIILHANDGCPGSHSGAYNAQWGEFGPTTTLEFNSGEKLSAECDGGAFKMLYDGAALGINLNCQENKGGMCVVGRCPWLNGACNEKYFHHSGDIIDKNGERAPDGDGMPDCLISTRWISKDYGLNESNQNPWLANPDPYPDMLDWAVWDFNVNDHSKPVRQAVKTTYRWGPPVPEISGCSPFPDCWIEEFRRYVCNQNGPQWDKLGKTAAPEGPPMCIIDIDSPVLDCINGAPMQAISEFETSEALVSYSNSTEPILPNLEGFTKPCDLNQDEICDSLDLEFFDLLIGSCIGSQDYNPIVDIDASSCIDSHDRLLLFESDSDLDGIPDTGDNCLLIANIDQRDSDGDGFGNMCDCDFNQDNFCGGPDFTLFIGCFNTATNNNPTCESTDMNGDGFVGGPDFTLFIGGFNRPPGP